MYRGLVTEPDGVREDLAARIRAICLALPGATERLSHSVPAWFGPDKRMFAQLWASGHHDNEFPHLWCANVPEGQQGLIAADPDRFFRPPYVGHRGWVGVRLDAVRDWAEVAEICQDAYQFTARPR